MRAGAARRRGARAVLALLVGLLVGAWAGGGLVWVFNRSKLRDPGRVADAFLAKADEVELVPADAVGFAHARLADLWKTETMAEFRKMLEKAGPDALKAVDEGFTPSPSTVERVTVVAVAGDPPLPPRGAPPLPGRPGGPPPAPDVFAIVAFAAPVADDVFRKGNLPNAAAATAGGKGFWQDPQANVAAYFPNDRTLVIGTVPAVTGFLTRPPKPDGPLAPAIRLAAGGTRHLVAAVNMTHESIGPGLRRGAPTEVAPVLEAESLTVGLVIDGGVKLDLRAVYKNETAARQAEDAVKSAADKGRKALGEMKTKMLEEVNGRPGQEKPRRIEELPGAVGGLFALGAINMADEWLTNLPLRRDGAELSAEAAVPSLGGASMQFNAVAIGLLLPAVQKVRDAAARATDANNLKQMAIAMHMHANSNGDRLPAAAITDDRRNPNNPDAKPLLSWRVAILPYVEHEALYRQFKLDEPWDGPHNKQLIPRMPRIYINPRAPAGPGMTYYKVFTGKGAMFDLRQGASIFVPDGTSNTIMIAGGGEPVVWTKPDDFPFDPKKPLPNLALPGSRVIGVAMGDGSVRTVDLDRVSQATLKAAVGMDDGTPLGNDW